MSGRIFPPNHRDYSRTHLFVFKGCRDTAKIIHPNTPDKKLDLIHEFVAHVIEAGFEVMGENAEPSFHYDVVCGDFGPDAAVTITGVLSGSHVALHGYLEHKGRVEILFNLCYLKNRRDHGPALEKVGPIFQRWLNARSFKRSNYKREYMENKKRKRKKKK
jgi:hypothetical protein